MSKSTKQQSPVVQKRGKPIHPNSLANLKPNLPWQPGESGNKQGYSLKSRLDDAMQKPLVRPSEDATVGELIVHSTLEGAIKREPTPFKEVWDRTEGKVPDKVDVDLTAGLEALLSRLQGRKELPEGEDGYIQ